MSKEREFSGFEIGKQLQDQEPYYQMNWLVKKAKEILEREKNLPNDVRDYIQSSMIYMEGQVGKYLHENPGVEF